ncbi:hypothetical protein FB451DRAFT_1027677, partial [Mycena latifolia]
FDCAVCQDSHSVEDVIRVEPCGHTFCRDCMTGHVRSKLTDRQYPIPCPNCLASNMVDEQLVELLPITEAEYAVFQEMSVAEFAVHIECPRCHEGALIERESPLIITCVFPRCRAVWCRRCSTLVQGDTRRHTCDGQAEMDDLVNRSGWKRCPTCSMAIEKTGGCNHITCTQNGCRTHFCYHCGRLIMRGNNPLQIHEALNWHYGRQCTGRMMD